MAIQRNRDAGTIFLTQETYTKAALAKFGMADSHPTTTPAEVGPMSTVEEATLTSDETTMFRGSRPDISHTILVLTKSMAKPGPKAWAKLMRLMRYLKGTASLGITYSEDASNGDKLTAYVDSDFARDIDDRKSTGVFIELAGGVVDSTATKQTVTAVSSAEAEHLAMSKAYKMILYWRHILQTINRELKEATILYEDSTGAISTKVYNSKSNKLTQRNKHIDVKYHHVRSLILDKVVDVKKIGTDCQ
ncbi:unnamed protein product [Ectocarpus sp. CCAP 1310/34]|nr:unnamed protein product [Ectocarpus sp. CCAP 1310/34]